jgi:hypothetical protein
MYFSLVVEDDEESYIVGSRPDWAKASNNINLCMLEVNLCMPILCFFRHPHHPTRVVFGRNAKEGLIHQSGYNKRPSRNWRRYYMLS